MEEESSKVHSEDEKVHSDKNKKRRVKTPFQVEALEKFYNEHKYPLESMKIELAEKIGLTEKQVSGWFCHRRLKDKRLSKDEACENGKLDRSSGVIQDHGSGLGQDSCGSTKPGDYNRHVHDPREEEEDIPNVNHTYGQNSHYARNSSGIADDDDDTSLDSTSSLQDVFISQGHNISDIKSSRYVTQNGPIIPKNGNVSENRAPSGYLKLKGNREHAAITAVKMQLGRHYQRDGPPLGIEFDTLPSGALETPIREPDNEPYFVNDPISPHPSGISGIQKQHFGDTTYDTYNSQINSQDPFMEHENIRTQYRPTYMDNHFHLQSKHKSGFPNYYSNHLSSRTSSLNTSEGSAGRNTLYDTNRNTPMRFKHGSDEMKLNSVSKTHFPSDEKIVNEDVNHKIVERRELFRSKPPSPMIWNNGSQNMTGEESSRRMAKGLSRNVKDEYPQQDYVTKLLYS